MKSPKLSIRDLLWLTVIVALAVMLWMNHKEVARLNLQLKTARKDAEVQRLAADEARQATDEARIAARVRQAELMIQLKQMEIAEAASKLRP